MDDAITKRHSRYLPHWTRQGAIYAITFRLADSLPQSKRVALEEEQSIILLSQKIEEILGAGYGTCALRLEHIASMVVGVLGHFNEQRYRLFAWCIMPNHVHIIVQPFAGFVLSKILHSWKSFTAQKTNEFLQRFGTFWQEESYDHIIRSEEELHRTMLYVWHNPDVAGLEHWPWRWRMEEDAIAKLCAMWDEKRDEKR